MKCLAVDFGEKRIGLATSDATGTLVTPGRTVLRKCDVAAAEEIARVAREEEIERIVVGLPVHADGSEGRISLRARSFARKLERRTRLPVELYDERHTSLEAARRQEPTRRGRSSDPVAAAVLLEDYLRSR